MSSIVRRLGEKNRTDQLNAIARELGVPVIPEYDGSLPGIGKLSRGSLLRQGRNRQIRNVIKSQADEGELIFFDYDYTIVVGGSEGRSSSHTYRQSVVYFRSPVLSLPRFALRPKSLLDKLLGLFRTRCIDLNQNAHFSRTYCLTCDDELQIRELLSLQALAFFETVDKVSVEATGEVFIMYRDKKRIKPGKLRQSMEEGLQLFALLRDSHAA